ncbi:holin BlyA [Oceanobacillus picturae]|jgi:Flp pilus assembly pilin Flp|uniref:Holin BlyA n=1 Tax=Oceanobacillus picturae TaxID=171693 RepID=A0A0U9HBU8_9BACI|nr:Flp1 family type IVb pilin [Oceanobacillus picturae]GAQ19899.1 holin BlyA [Oceanobacillus picturae]
MKKFKSACKKFWKDEDGLQTLEIMLIIAVIVVIALLFRDKIVEWVKSLLEFGGGEIDKFKQGGTGE